MPLDQTVSQTKAADAVDSSVPLYNRAMIARLATHRWHALKTDTAIAKDVAARTGSEASRHRHSRLLLAKEAMAEINTAFNAAKAFHLLNTSPWEDGGMRILSSRRSTKYHEGIKQLQRDVERAAEKFAKGYPALLAHEKATNPLLFNASDYPTVSEIRGRFSISIDISNIPNPDDFRIIGMDDAETARIRREMHERTEQKLNAIVTDLWTRLHKCVAHISDRMAAYNEREQRIAEGLVKATRRRGANKGKLSDDIDTRTGIFTDTLMENLIDVVDVIPDLDMSDNPQLAAVRSQVMNLLCPHKAEDLRKSPALRDRVKANADKILATVSEFLG